MLDTHSVSTSFLNKSCSSQDGGETADAQQSVGGSAVERSVGASQVSSVASHRPELPVARGPKVPPTTKAHKTYN